MDCVLAATHPGKVTGGQQGKGPLASKVTKLMTLPGGGEVSATHMHFEGVLTYRSTSTWRTPPSTWSMEMPCFRLSVATKTGPRPGRVPQPPSSYTSAIPAIQAPSSALWSFPRIETDTQNKTFPAPWGRGSVGPNQAWKYCMRTAFSQHYGPSELILRWWLAVEADCL
eukprot:353596-Chlamydomonas_euryale.AAC.9